VLLLENPAPQKPSWRDLDQLTGVWQMPQNTPQHTVFEPSHDTEYRRIVNPDRVVVMPGYSLRLLTHGELTPKELSLWLAFRQAVYTKDREVDTVTANIPNQWLRPFAMMSRTNFWREVGGKDSLCGGLVTLVPSQDTGESHRQIAHANRYQISMYPRLTRRDAGVIQGILTRAAGNGDDFSQRIEKQLRDLVTTSPGSYLDKPGAVPAQVTGWPRTLAEIVRRVLAGRETANLATLAKLANRLQERILASYGKIVVSHYFLRTIVPQFEMTQAQAWTVIALRYRAWFDYTNGERWPFAIVHGGLEEVAALTGSSVKSIRRWLDEPGFSSLVSVADTSDVQLPEFWSPETVILNVNLLEPVGDVLDTLGLDGGQSGTRKWTHWDSMVDKAGLANGQIGTPLNRFISVINRHNRAKNVNFDFAPCVSAGVAPEDFVPDDFSAAAAGEDENLFLESRTSGGDAPGLGQIDNSPQSGGDVSGWSLDDLVRINTVSRKKASEMVRAGVTGQGLASWIAEAWSRQGIDRPIALAVVSALDYPTGAPGVYADLFARPRAEVLELLAQAIAGYPVTEPVIRKFSTEKRRSLYLALGGTEANIPARYAAPARPAPAHLVEQAPTPVDVPEHIQAEMAAIQARIKAQR
jgi:hypothetical protein